MSFPKTYMRSSVTALRKVLAARRLTPAMANDIIQEVIQAKKERRTAQQKDGQHARLWRDLIAPAKAERRIIQRMRVMNVKNPSDERDAALEAYELVLNAIIGRLTLASANTTEMPRYVAVEKKLPNKGEHWVDWMPPKKIALIEEYFAGIPYMVGVKQKLPFERRIPLSQHDTHKKRLIERTSKEIDMIERRIAVELADSRLTDTHVFKHQEIGEMRLQVSQMQAAMHRVSLLNPNDFVPVTWHGVKQPD
jgi:hypothetical protein